ncbi:MAG: hypothetical protein V1903_05875 [Bacteroidota bacterium]
MIISDDIKVTTEILLKGALFFLLIDTVFVSVLTRLIKAEDLVKMKWRLITVMALFFFLLFGSIVSIIFWDSVYSYVFPPRARWIIPPLYGILFSMAGLLFWWIATRLKKYAVIIFLLLGGLWGVITHVLAILRGILEKPPMLKGSSPAAALTIAAFEFIFYWCICLIITRFVQVFIKPGKNEH